jgi:ketosteroid isomerase-like protein
MSPEMTRVVSAGVRRPLEDRILVRLPFLADRAASRLAHLPPGSSLRRRLILRALRHGFDAVSRNDPEVVLLGYEPDVEIFSFGAAGLGLAERYSGHQGWLDFVSDITENFADPRYTVNRVLDAGDRWVAEVEFLGQGQTSGATVGNNWGTVYLFSPRGKIQRQDVFWQDGWEQALEAAGLSE